MNADKKHIQAVILDWAGTAVDHGCMGPVAVFKRAFEKFGLEPTLEEIRAPMGTEKRSHVVTMLAMPRLAALWRQKYGNDTREEDIDAIFAYMQAIMPDTLADYAEPVPGCVDAMRQLRESGIKIGSCTGYSRSMMPGLLRRAKQAGYEPDCLITADDVPQGRPMPWMCWQNCMKLEVFPPETIIKVGDTAADICEGLNAGHWSVGVTRTSSDLGLTIEDLGTIPEDVLRQKEEELERKFFALGAHYVISSVADLPRLCETINAALANGRSPGNR